MHFMQTMDTPTMNTFSISELKDIFYVFVGHEVRSGWYNEEKKSLIKRLKFSKRSPLSRMAHPVLLFLYYYIYLGQ